MNSNLHL